MAVKPTNNPTDWATDTTGVALKMETTEYHKTYGWGIVTNIPEVPNLNEVNYWRFSVHEWLQYLDAAAGERDNEILLLNQRIDDLSSADVSYEFSNEDSSNIYPVDFDTFTEFDGTTSTRYRLDNNTVTLSNDENVNKTNVLSLTDDSVNDDIAQIIDSQQQYETAFQEYFNYSNENKMRDGKSNTDRLKKRFKVGVYAVDNTDIPGSSNKGAGSWEFRYSVFNPNTARYETSVKRFTISDSSTPTFLKGVYKNENVCAAVFVSQLRYSVYLYTYATNSLKNITLGNFTGTAGNLIKPSAFRTHSQGWILQPTTDGKTRDIFVFTATFIDEALNNQNNAWDMLYILEDNVGYPVSNKITCTFGNNNSLAYYTSRLLKGQTSSSWAEKSYCVTVNESSPEELVLDYFYIYGGSPGNVNGTDRLNSAFTHTGSQRIRNVDYKNGSTPFFGTSLTGGTNLEGLNNVPLRIAGSSYSWDDWGMKTTWSNLSEPDGILVVAGVGKYNGTSYQTSGTNGNLLNYNVLVFKRANLNEDKIFGFYNLEIVAAFKVGNTSSPRPDGADSYSSGITSLSLLNRSGNRYTFTVGYRCGSGDIDASKSLKISEDRILDLTNNTFNIVNDSAFYTSILTDDEDNVWRKPAIANGANNCDLDASINNYYATKQIFLRSRKNFEFSNVLMSECYQDGYFVRFVTNQAEIFGEGEPPGKPGWEGTVRTIYRPSAPFDGIPTLFTSPLNNTITEYVNGVDSETPLSPVGNFVIDDGSLRSFGMLEFYPAADRPTGFNEQFTKITLVQYDAFVPGLGTVQAALDNLYAQSESTLSLEPFGGDVVSPAFNSYVQNLVTPTRYVQTGLVVTDQNSFSITHNLQQKIVQVAVYNEADDAEVICGVTLVDDNNLVITSSVNATVSVVVIK